MWAVLKINKCNLETLKKELYDKLGCDIKFYTPRLKLRKFLKKKSTYKRTFFIRRLFIVFS